MILAIMYRDFFSFDSQIISIAQGELFLQICIISRNWMWVAQSKAITTQGEKHNN